jgi:hypothetical protein
LFKSWGDVFSSIFCLSQLLISLHAPGHPPIKVIFRKIWVSAAFRQADSVQGKLVGLKSQVETLRRGHLLPGNNLLWLKSANPLAELLNGIR